MKLNYFGYSIEHEDSGKKHLTDIRPFLSCFCLYRNMDYKNKFTHNNEQVFLMDLNENLYLFLSTRENDIIKSINSTDHSITDIYTQLRNDQKLGFASYIYVESSSFGYAATQMSPKNTAFVLFINNIFDSLSLAYNFVALPLLQKSSRLEAMSMPFIGRSVIQVNKENSFFHDIQNIVKGKAEEFSDVDSFEIIIKPRSRKNIEAAAKKVIAAVPDQGLNKMIISAKEEVKDVLVDFYLVGQGILSDNISKKNELELRAEIIERFTSNELLVTKVKEHEGDEAISKDKLEVLFNFNNDSSWSIAIYGLPSSE